MACATLKRSLDWESLNQRPTKRRRCHPFGSPSSSNAQNSPSSSASAMASSSSNSAMRVMEPKPSPFAEAVCPKLTPGKFNCCLHVLWILYTINAYTQPCSQRYLVNSWMLFLFCFLPRKPEIFCAGTHAANFDGTEVFNLITAIEKRFNKKKISIRVFRLSTDPNKIIYPYDTNLQVVALLYLVTVATGKDLSFRSPRKKIWTEPLINWRAVAPPTIASVITLVLCKQACFSHAACTQNKVQQILGKNKSWKT